VLDKNEVADAMEDLGLAREIGPAEINLLCFSGDSDKDGKIDFSEFVNDFVHYDFESQVPCRTRSPRSLGPLAVAHSLANLRWWRRASQAGASRERQHTLTIEEIEEALTGARNTSPGGSGARP